MDTLGSFYQYALAANFLVTDEDAADFLQSQFTNELRPYEVGQCTYGLWLDVKGKVVADSVVLCEGEERFRILSERCEGEDIAAHMERHIIADDVAIEHCALGYGIEVSAEGVLALGLELPKAGRFVTFGGGILFSVQNRLYNMVIDSESEASAVLVQLQEAGFTPYSESERGLARIDRGIPLVPEEIGAADLPGEGELERDAISFSKGCYLGQEVVARMHNIGKPQRGLFVLRGAGVLPVVPIAIYNRDSKQVGELRSAYAEGENWRGVAILKTRFASVGDTLYLESDEVFVLNPLRKGVVDV